MRHAYRQLMFLLCLLVSASFSSATIAAVQNKSDLQTIMHDGAKRSYLVRAAHIPEKPKQAVPLVIVLHGGGGNAAITERMTGFTRKAIKERFIVVYPNGSSHFEDKLLTWNATHCCGYAMEKNVDDVGFIAAMLTQLLKDYPIDAKRVYVTGLSNGGMMSHKIGIELSDRIAAIAPVISGLFGDEKLPAQAVAALMINGMLDESVPHLGGAPGGRFAKRWRGTHVKPASYQAEFWAKANGCKAKAIEQDVGFAMHWKHSCPNQKTVELYLVKDNGHAWPGGQAGTGLGDTPSTSMNATDVIWEFFKKSIL